MGETRVEEASTYVEALFSKGDTVAMLAVPRKGTGGVVQEVMRAEKLARRDSVERLGALNRMGYDVYCTVNAVVPTARSRTKGDIASVRRLQLDLDENGREGLARLRRDVDSGVVPTPAVVMQSSRGRFQVLWNTSAGTWSPEHAERTMTRLAGRYGGDFAVADVARVMRMPGFQNQKDGREGWTVTWARYGGGPVIPQQFAALPEVERQATPAPERERKQSGVSRSERDWAWVRSQLRRGTEPEELRSELARRRSDKPSPEYYARRTVDRAVESLAADRRARLGAASRGEAVEIVR